MDMEIIKANIWQFKINEKFDAKKSKKIQI
jgi:hypothetical protein